MKAFYKIIKHIIKPENIFLRVFRWSILALLITNSYSLLGRYPEPNFLPYGKIIYIYVEPFIKLINAISIALFGAVVFFYIQEYRTFSKYKLKYEKIEKNLCNIIRSNLKYILRNNLVKESIGEDAKEMLFCRNTNLKKMSFSQKSKYAKQIKKYIFNNKLEISYSQAKEIASNKVCNLIWYKEIEKYYHRSEISFKKIEDKIIDVIDRKFHRDIWPYSLDENLSNSDSIARICNQVSFKAKYKVHLKNIICLYIELLEVLENPKENVIKKL